MPDDTRLSDSDGVLLIKIARMAVTEFLSNGKRMKLESEDEKKFSFNSGVFVTLNNADGLRGCIGFPMPNKKLSHGIIDAAIAAATEDPRFSPVKINELNEIVFEVTVLTPPVEITITDPMEYLEKIKVGRDGLIISNSFSSGLLLPQVPVEYGWNVEEFLQHTCEKAGLGRDVWKNEKVKIEKFEGIVYKEETNGS
ncbi:MAG: AMMECR1 domain-containing protein [Thaumarchaeota archaeon]|nr:AMMECR1 domain-containing protein [Nitrososphaerota archaeon]